MLALDRYEGESIIIDDCIEIKIIRLSNSKVRLGIEAPREIPVHRKEVQEAIDREKELVMPVASG